MAALPQSELDKLQIFKARLKRRRAKTDSLDEYNSLSEMIETLSSQIRTPIGTEVVGTFQREGQAPETITEPIFKREEVAPSPKRLGRLKARAARLGISPAELTPAAKITDKEVKTRKFMEEWNVRPYDERFDSAANATRGLDDVPPHQKEEYKNSYKALMKKPKIEAEETLYNWKQKTQIRKAMTKAGIEYSRDRTPVENIEFAESELKGEKLKEFRAKIMKIGGRFNVDTAIRNLNKILEDIEWASTEELPALQQRGEELIKALLDADVINEEQAEEYRDILAGKEEEGKKKPENIPEGAKATGKHYQGKPVYILPNGQGWIPD